MVRTADSSLRVAGGKSTRKGGNVSVRQESSRSRSPPSSSGDKGSGLNPICPRETPSWQRPITNFFIIADKSGCHNNKGGDDKPGSSKSVAEDINMVEVDNEDSHNDPQSSNRSKQSFIEAMDEEFHEIKIDKNENNKENETNLANEISSGQQLSNDTEMEEFKGNTKKKLNARDDADEEVAPAKRMKLDKNVYKHLHELEQW